MARKIYFFFALAISLLGACRTSIPSAVPLVPVPPHAGLMLPNIFSHNMVLQQGTLVPIWGWGDDGDTVTVTFRAQKVTARVKEGKWMAKLKNLQPGGPDVLTISEKTAIELTNVLVGEVWLASGQSNMEIPLSQSQESAPDIAESANPSIRFFYVPQLKLATPTNNTSASWTLCNSNTAASMSAVGYYFARELQKARNLPVGLIESDHGSSPAEAWTRREVLASNPRYQKEILDTYSREFEKYSNNLAAYVSQKEKAKKSNKEFKKAAPLAPWQPGALYNAMLAPLIPYAIKGVLWYQGENNAPRAAQYRSLLPDMIRNWRKDWGEGDFSFLIVQIAPYTQIKHQPAESTLAELREAQFLTTKVVPNTGLAVITDVGDENEIHPPKKQPVGARLALAARAITYGEPLEYSGPLFKSMVVEGDQAVLSFDHAGKGLVAREGALKGFSICGNDKKFVWALASIVDTNKVVVTSPNVPHPVAVRFGWADFPIVNLWNKDGLPACPFRTDDFPMITANKK